jgi:ribosomal protein S7
MNNKKLKDKLLNYIFSDGQKKTSEKIIKKTFKSIQKSQKKSHKDIIKLAIINSTPTFRIIKLKNNKKKKKKMTKDIPAFLSTYNFRTAWSLKYLTKTFNNFNTKLEQDIILNAKNQGNAVKLKNELQNQLIKKNTYLKYYRW